MNDITTPNGIRVAFDDLGSGPPVVLTHGWVVGREMWEYAAAPMADAGMRVISVDRRGCGGSDRPSRGFDFDTLAAHRPPRLRPRRRARVLRRP